MPKSRTPPPGPRRKSRQVRWPSPPGERLTVPSALLALLRRQQPGTSTLTPGELALVLVLLVLRKDGTDFNVSQLAERTGLSTSQTRKLLASLEKKGFVERVRTIGSHAQNTTPVFDLSGLAAAIGSDA